MPSESWRRAKSLFFEICELPPEEWPAALDHHCDGDSDLVAEVESLLRHLERTLTPVVDQLDGTRSLGEKATGITLDALSNGTRVGKYTIVDLLGMGGMGVVYRARQERPARDVALKLLATNVATTQQMARFEVEAEALGRLKHPGIAAVYEAGVAEVAGASAPFVAMELVEGQPLTTFAKHQSLDTHEKLVLLAVLCDAVHHAHVNGVIHRDLKPSNILVEASGRPRVLDFGIARVTDSDVKSATIATDRGQIFGTLQYMSPEQASGDASRIDARSDVYALGAISYETLSNEKPYDLRDLALVDALQAIAERDPKPLTSVASGLDSDVGIIVNKALEKEPDRRYQSASALATDIRRFLNDEPIAARPPSTVYQIRKLAARNKPLFAASAFALVVLIVASVLISLSLARAIDAESVALAERDAAQAALARERTLGEFIRDDLLEAADPFGETGPDVTVRELVDRAVETAGERFARQPALEASIRSTLGSVYQSLSYYSEAKTQLETALGLMPADENVERALLQWRLGQALVGLGDAATAEELFRQALDVMQANEQAAATRGVQLSLASLLGDSQRFDEAESLLESIIESAAPTRELRQTRAMALGNLSAQYGQQQRFDESIEVGREALLAVGSVWGPSHPRMIVARLNLALALGAIGRADEAVSEAVEAVELAEQVLPPDHDQLGAALDALAYAEYTRGNYGQAIEAYKRALPILVARHGSRHPSVLIARGNLGSAHQQRGELDQADAHLGVVLEAAEAAASEDPVSYAFALLQHGSLRLTQKRWSEAFDELSRSARLLEESFGPRFPLEKEVATWLAECLDRLGRSDEAAVWRRRAADAGP